MCFGLLEALLLTDFMHGYVSNDHFGPVPAVVVLRSRMFSTHCCRVIYLLLLQGFCWLALVRADSRGDSLVVACLGGGLHA